VFPGIGFPSVAMAAMGVAAAVAAGGAIGIITYQTSSDGMCRFFFTCFFFCNLIFFRLVHPPKKPGMTKSWKIRMIISANRGLAVAILLHHHVPWWFL